MTPGDKVAVCHHKPAVFVFFGNQSHYLIKSIIKPVILAIITFPLWEVEGVCIVLLAVVKLQCKSICLP